jgi:dTDP-4-dehydrorhamnose 3,5-epimerase
MKETTPNGIPSGLRIFELKKFGDERGKFWESYKKESFPEDINFLQDNFAFSQRGALRGLHFQKPPFAQGKLVQIIKGKVLDVVVDVRKKSPTYGQSFQVELSETNGLLFWVPEGFAHGYLTLEDNTIFHYKCSNTYSPENEGAIRWNDTDLNINWGISDPILSDKDRNADLFSELDSLF